MNDDLFKTIEKRLYDYFQTEKKISCLRQKIQLLNKHITDIEKKIKETNILIPEESRSSTYEDSVQTSRNTSSYAENAAIKIIEDMEREVVYKQNEITHLEKIIRNTESDNAIIKYNLAFLSADHIRILELKYAQKKKDWQVGMEMNIERSTITRIKQKLIADIARWDKFIAKHEQSMHQICTKDARHKA